MSFVWYMIVMLASVTSFPPKVVAFQPPNIIVNNRMNLGCTLTLQLSNGLRREINESLGDNSPQTRQSFLQDISVASVVIPPTFCTVEATLPAHAFDGGIGGLGKTKPQTGVQFFGDTSGPIQNDKGIVTAEIQSISGKPILVSFQTPWPLLTSSKGLEARDLRNSESAFLQVLSTPKNIGSNWKDKKIFEQLLLSSVLSPTGKFGAYGQPFNIQVKPLVKKLEDDHSSNFQQQQQQQQQLFSVTFTTLTPAMRESERKVWIQSQQIDPDTLVLLVTGTTAVRFPNNEAVFLRVIDSFQAIKAPESKLR
jgi:hypothetical protein